MQLRAKICIRDMVLVSKIKGGMKQNLRGMIGGLLVKPVLKKTMKDFDASEYGGAPLLGLTGLVVKTHGSSKAKEVCNSILQCVTSVSYTHLDVYKRQAIIPRWHHLYVNVGLTEPKEKVVQNVESGDRYQ